MEETKAHIALSQLAEAKQRRLYLLPLVFLGLLCVHAAYYFPFFSDDALISLRYSDRLLQGKGLTWTEGRPVEGYSNLLWVLLVALLGALRVDLILAARVLGVVCMGAVIVFSGARYLKPGRPAGSLLGFVVGMLFFVGAAPTAVWAIGGLEQPLVAAALAGGIALYGAAAEGGFQNRRLVLALSTALGMLCLTRPDGPLFVVATLMALLRSGGKQRLRVALAVLLVPALAFVGQLVFRLAYYGEWVTNTALVKITPSPRHLSEGLHYVLDGLLALFPSSLVALVLFGIGLATRTSRQHFFFLLALLVLWLGYLVGIGGDIFPAYRHFVPVVVVLAFVLSEGTVVVWERLAGKAQKRTLFVSALLGVMVCTSLLQFNNPRNAEALTERWEWQGRSLALTLKAAFGEKKPVLAVTAAGCLPYWSELPSLDMLGLNDYYLPRHKPKSFGTGYLGHELGDADYILRCAPDLIVFNTGSEPLFLIGEQLSAHAEFQSTYARVRVRTAYAPEYTALIWCRVTSTQVGQTKQGKRHTIPAYFLNLLDTTHAYLDQGRLVIGVSASQPAGIQLAALRHGTTVQVLSPQAERITATLQNTERGHVVLLTTASEQPVPVEALVLTAP